VRLQRIQRDIPVKHIASGVVKSNVRQLAGDIMQKEGTQCRCIRCREIGHKVLKGLKPDPDAVRMDIEKYKVTGGLEHFISFEEPTIDALVGFCRLRFPCRPHRPELADAAIIRELHVYGRMVPIGENNENWQHRGYGTELLKQAAELSKDAGYKKLAIMSGIGARPYYKKLGFDNDGPYMSRRI
jgi:elongator complex protein 3